MKYQKWNIEQPDPRTVQTLQEAGFPLLVSTVLAARGVKTPEAARALLKQDEKPEFSPLLMKDMDRAVARIRAAVARGETVAVFGDYDVDGITSTVLLTDYLKRTGIPCLRHIPRRVEDGYGLSKNAIAALHEQGAALLISVDCGITGGAEVAYANTLGMDVVVTDHHECKGDLPEAVAVVDPHRPDCPYPFKHLAGCGVALKLVMALGGPQEEEALFARYAPLAALGTVADVMRMEGENRTIVQRGLDALPHTDFVGLLALLKEAGLRDKTVSATQVGFLLAPRINAAGRMGRVDLAVELLECRDSARAEELAKQLCTLNRERQSVEQAIFADAEHMIPDLSPAERHALILASDQWNQGVIGIVASRLSEKYACPAFMIQLKDGTGKGSCRSWGGLNLFAALESCADLLEGFGGHALAAGFTISEEKIGAFRARMNRYVVQAYGENPPVSALEVDAAISVQNEMAYTDAEEVAALDALEPYGNGNPQPVFALLGARVDEAQNVGQGRHLKLRLSRGALRFDAIFFSMTLETCGVQVGTQVDAAFYLRPNTFRGVTSVQLQMIDIRPSLYFSPWEAEDRALVKRLIAGEAVTAREAERLRLSREQFVICWKVLKRFLSGEPSEKTSGETSEKKSGAEEKSEEKGKTFREADAPPFLRFMAEQTHSEEGFLHAALALEVFRERGLLDMEEREGRFLLSTRDVREKVNLEECPYLVRLRAL